MEKINFKEDELKSVNNDDAKTLGKLCQDLVDAEAHV